MRKEEARLRLGIEENTGLTEAAINQAFRLTALRYHPDKHAGADEETQVMNAELFKKAGEAKKILLNATRVELTAAAGGGGGGAAEATEQRGPTLPHKLTIIQGNHETTEYNDVQLFFKTLRGQNITAIISLGNNQDGISTRCVLESLFIAYLRTNDVDYRAIFLALQDGVAGTQAIVAPNTDALVLVESDDDSFAPLPELKQLTDEQFEQLLEKMKLRWVSMGKLIRPTSDNIPPKDIAALTHGGHFLLPSLAGLLAGPTTGELTVAKAKPDETAIPAEQAPMRLTMDLSSVGAYLNDDIWGDPAPAGIKAMRDIFNPKARDIKVLLESMQGIAQVCQLVNQQPESQPGWLHNQSLSARVNKFYDCLMAATNMDDVIRFVRSEANPSQALVPAAAAAGNGW
jgi:hypothetical protein